MNNDYTFTSFFLSMEHMYDECIFSLLLLNNILLYMPTKKKVDGDYHEKLFKMLIHVYHHIHRKNCGFL